MFKKGVGVILAIFILLSIIAPGCSNNGSQTTTSGAQTATQEASKEAEKITLRVLFNFSNPQQAKGYADRLEMFTQKYPNVTIDDWSVGDENVFDDKFKTAVAQGDPPEIFVNYGGASKVEYAKNNVMADLTDILSSDKDWYDRISKDLYQQWQFTDCPGVYGIPYARYGVELFYNKDLFSQIGKEPPETLEALEEVAGLFKAKGITPLALGDKDNFKGGQFFSSMVVKAFGGQKMLDLAGGKAKWTDKDMVELMEYLKHLKDIGLFGENIVTLDYSGEVAAFENQTAAMHTDGTWYLGTANSSSIADKIGCMPFPYFSDKPQYKDGMAGGATGAVCMSGLISDPAKKEAAINLLKFITSTEHFKYMWDMTGGGFIAPVNIVSDLGADSSTMPRITREFLDIFDKVTDLKNEPHIYTTVLSMMDLYRDRIQGVLAGSITPQQACEQIQAALDNG